MRPVQQDAKSRETPSTSRSHDNSGSRSLRERVRGVCLAVPRFVESISKLHECRQDMHDETNFFNELKALGSTKPRSLRGQAGESAEGAPGAIERVRMDLEAFLEGSSSKLWNRRATAVAQKVPRESLLALSSAPKWSLLHEHRYQMHRDARRTAPMKRSTLSAASIMDIFLTEEAEAVQKLNGLCGNMELEIKVMEKRFEESRRMGYMRSDQDREKEEANVAASLEEVIEDISKRLAERSTTIPDVCGDIGVQESGVLNFDGWCLLLMILNVPLPDKDSTLIFEHLAEGGLTRGIAVSELVKLVEAQRKEAAEVDAALRAKATRASKQKPRDEAARTGRGADEEVGSGTDGEGAPARPFERPSDAVQEIRQRQSLQAQKQRHSTKANPYDSLSKEERALAELCVSEHIIARKEQNVARYIRKRREFLQKNVQLQQAYMKTREREQQHAERQKQKRLVFQREKERLLNELRKQNKVFHNGDGLGESTSSGSVKDAAAAADRRVVERLGRPDNVPSYFHDDMSQEQRKRQLKTIQRQQHLSVRRAFTGHEVSAGSDSILSDVRLASCEYALRLRIEGGGIDPRGEEVRAGRLLRDSAIIFQRIWRRHLFRRYLWAHAYFRDQHHAYQLFERCIPAKRVPSLRPMEACSFVHDAVPDVTKPRHTHALPLPVDDMRIVAEVPLVAKLLVELNLPLSVNKMRQAIVALELRANKTTGTPVGPVTSASSPPPPARFGFGFAKPGSPAKKKPSVVTFPIFLSWWTQLIPPPFDGLTMVRVLQAAKQQHGREIAAAHDEAVQAKTILEAALIWKGAKDKQGGDGENQERPVMKEVCDHADADYARRQTRSKHLDHQEEQRRIQEMKKRRKKPRSAPATEEDELQMFRAVYEDGEWAPSSRRTKALLGKAGDLHRVRMALHNHRTAVVALSQCEHDEHDRSHKHARNFRRETAGLIERRHRAMSAHLGSNRTGDEDLLVVTRPATANTAASISSISSGRKGASKPAGAGAAAAVAAAAAAVAAAGDYGAAMGSAMAGGTPTSLLDPQHFDAFEPHYLRSTKFEKSLQAHALHQSQVDNRIEALENAALHKQRALSLLRLNGKEKAAHTIAAAEASDWAAAASGLPFSATVSLGRTFVKDHGNMKLNVPLLITGGGDGGGASFNKVRRPKRSKRRPQDQQRCYPADRPPEMTTKTKTTATKITAKSNAKVQARKSTATTSKKSTTATWKNELDGLYYGAPTYDYESPWDT